MTEATSSDGGEADRARFRALGSYAGVEIDDAREFLRRMRPAGGPEVARVVNLAPDSGPGVAVRIYHPRPDAVLPVLVWTHGGGWCVGDADTTDEVCRHLASRIGCVVVSIDHRRAPEHPFPAPLDDVVTALEWVVAEAPRIGADPTRVAVGGESSGANLTLAALLRRQAAGSGGRPVCQVLVVPLADLDDRPSMRNDRDPGLTVADLRWFHRQYAPGSSDPQVFPLHAPSLEGLPPTTVVTAGRDPLRDSGLALVARLIAGGVAVDHLHRPDAGHGLLGDLSYGAPGCDVLGRLVALLRAEMMDSGD